MTTLVSDETLGKVVRLVWERPILCADRTAIMTHVLEDQWAAALDVARELLSPEDDAIAALDRANEEAAEEYTKRETEEHAATCGPLEDQEPSGAVPGTVTMSGEAILLDGTRLDLSDREAVKRAVEAVISRDPIAIAQFNPTPEGQKMVDDIDALLQSTRHDPPPFKVDPLIVSPEVERDLMRVERDEARRERDDARAELAATKKKLQGVMYGRRKR